MKEELSLKDIKEVDTYFLKLIQDTVKNLDIIDELIETNGQRQSEVDSILSDYLHLIEDKNLSDLAALEVMQEIKMNREKRRRLRNEYEIIKSFEGNKNKLVFKNQRQFFTNEIYKKFTSLNQPYKMRILNEEKINELTHMENIKNSNDITSQKRKYKKCIWSDEKIRELLNNGKKAKEIAEILDIPLPTAYAKIKKVKEVDSSNGEDSRKTKGTN